MQMNSAMFFLIHEGIFNAIFLLKLAYVCYKYAIASLMFFLRPIGGNLIRQEMFDVSERYVENIHT